MTNEVVLSVNRVRNRRLVEIQYFRDGFFVGDELIPKDCFAPYVRLLFPDGCNITNGECKLKPKELYKLQNAVNRTYERPPDNTVTLDKLENRIADTVFRYYEQ